MKKAANRLLLLFASHPSIQSIYTCMSMWLCVCACASAYTVYTQRIKWLKIFYNVFRCGYKASGIPMTCNGKYMSCDESNVGNKCTIYAIYGDRTTAQKLNTDFPIEIIILPNERESKNERERETCTQIRTPPKLM